MKEKQPRSDRNEKENPIEYEVLPRDTAELLGMALAARYDATIDAIDAALQTLAAKGVEATYIDIMSEGVSALRGISTDLQTKETRLLHPNTDVQTKFVFADELPSRDQPFIPSFPFSIEGKQARQIGSSVNDSYPNKFSSLGFLDFIPPSDAISPTIDSINSLKDAMIADVRSFFGLEYITITQTTEGTLTLEKGSPTKN